jgi:signal transduction histidine kinase/ActR/RegA family two-component response regulator
VVTALRDEKGNLRGFAKVLRNATEHKQAREERERLIEQLEEERSRLEAALAREQEARKEAEAANRTKDEFLTTVSHELRTPLTSMLGWTRLLRSGKLEKDIAERALESIERNAKSQAQLVEDILDVSRIIVGKLRLDIIPVELAPVIKGAVETIRPAAAAKSIDLKVELDASVGPVLGDPDRLQQITWNLLSNAVKFTARQGCITIRLEQVGSNALITVSDTGIGISPELLPYVFDRFRQADSTSTRRYGGLGLGLAIVRHLVELHGGAVHAQSPGEGQGATFSVLLPLAAVRLAREYAKSWLEPSQLPSLDGIHVLLVDDDADTLEMLTFVLQQRGARVTAAVSSDQALEALKQSEPDILLSDIGMAGEDGYALIRKVRAWASERKRQLPAVALTAYAKSEDRLRVIEAGFQMYLPKPVEPAELVATIANLVGRAQKSESA